MMLNNFIIAVEAVLPTFLLILLGMGSRRLHILTDKELNHVNKFVFQVMFPFMMFYNIYSADFSGVLLPSYFGFCMLMLLIVYLLGFAAAMILEKDNYSRGALVQVFFRSNFVLMGLPIVQNLMGEKSLGLTTMMIAIVVPSYNVLAVVTLEIFRGGDINLLPVMKKIITNPLIIGAAAGLLAVLLDLRLPTVLEKPIGQVASSSSPIALLVLGASFHFDSVRDNLRNLLIGVAGKLVISPFLALSAAYLLGIRETQLAILIIMFGAPCAVSGYTMAQQMDSNAELYAGCLIFSSLLSCVTVCVWIFIFKQLGAF